MPTAPEMLDREPDVVRIEVSAAAPAGCDVLVVGLTGDAADPAVSTAVEDSGDLARRFSAVRASTSVGSTTRIPAAAGEDWSSVLAVGLGSDGEPDAETVRRAAGAAARALRGCGVVAFALAPGHAADVAEGAALGSYRPAKVTAGADESDDATEADRFVVVDAGATDGVAERANAVAECVGLARDLVNCPPNLLYPASFAERAAALATAAGLEVEVLDEHDLSRGGYGGILGVGAGSSRPPRLVRLVHRGRGGAPTVALVGKGITFDTGGISIKPAAGMEKMTSDMGGAAAVVATAILAARLGVDATVIATVPMAENMPSGTAYRPGDVLTMYGGQTVEVLNTDAEGRLILADAISRACEDEPDYLVDTATLTGAQMVALGNRTPGVMGDDDFRDRVAELSRSVGEGGWPMPLPEELRAGLDSPVADLANVTNQRWGGMLVAALFLKEFVGEGVRWAHVDVAGPAYNDGSPSGYLPKGGTGVPVRTMLAVLEDVAAESAGA